MKEEALLGTLEDIADYYSYLFTPLEKDEQEMYLKRWHYVAYDVRKYLQQLDIIRNHMNGVETPINFLELGSGFGLFLRIFKGFFPGSRVTGIEINEKLTELSRKMFPGVHVITGDAMQFSSYGEYNVIYYYRLNKDEDIQKDHEYLIENECKEGTYLICNFKNDSKILTDKRFERLGGNVFWKRES